MQDKRSRAKKSGASPRMTQSVVRCLAQILIRNFKQPSLRILAAQCVRVLPTRLANEPRRRGVERPRYGQQFMDVILPF